MKKIILLVVLIFSIQIKAQNIIWDQNNGPHIVRGCINLNGDTLTINNTEVIFEDGCLNIINGKLYINNSVLRGTYNRVSNKILHLERSYMTIRHAEFDLDHYVSAGMSTLDIENLKSIDNKSNMLFFLTSSTNLFLSKSQIENYDEALYLFGTRNVYIKNNLFRNNKTAIKDSSSSLVEINYNDFENNDVAINSYSLKTNAENNYFDGINSSFGNFVINSRSKEKNIKDKGCCSNVLFIPGIMSTRLFLENNQLWEPNRNADVKKLFLNAFGQSINNIYIKDVISMTNLFLSNPYVDKIIYKDFIDYLIRLKRNLYINDYKIIPYDWRMSPEIDLIQTVKDLQKTSVTGKVTIVTHSNGGLIAKNLIYELNRLNMGYLIDNVIFVAMPEYGTPQAITSLMSGHNQSILSGLILKSNIAKEWSYNMISAYMLLPSNKYYQYKNIKHFNKDDLNQYLFNLSVDFHNKIDNMIYPENISVYQILGTGLNTVSDVNFINNQYEPIYNKEGDGTVQDLYGLRYGTSTYINLNNSDYKHYNIMNHIDVISNINSILKIRNKKIYVGLNYNNLLKNIKTNIIKLSSDNNNSFSLNMNIDSKGDNLRIDNQNFLQVEENSDNRFEVSNNDIYYLSDNKESFALKSNEDDLINIELIKDDIGQRLSSKYINIPIYKGVSQSISIDNENVLTLRFTDTDTVIKYYDVNATNTKILTKKEKIEGVLGQIKTSKINKSIKNRYMNKISLYLKEGNDEYLNNIISHLKETTKNNLLKRKYNYTWRDYLYIYTLLLKS